MIARPTSALIVMMLTLGSADIAVAAPAAKEIAKQRFREGQKFYNLGQFDKAVEEFSKAYAAQPLAAFLFNLGQCEKQLKHYERAVFFFDRFLREAPDAKNRSVVTELLREAKLQLAAEETERHEAERREAERQAHAEAQMRAEAEAQMRAETAVKQGSTTADTALDLVAIPPATPFYQRWWFWGIAGAAVVAVGGVLLALNTGGEVVEKSPEGSLGMLDRR